LNESKYDQFMDFLNAVFEEIMNFLGFIGIQEALKTENYGFFKSFDGVVLHFHSASSFIVCRIFYCPF
jgi:hypothetical protein